MINNRFSTFQTNALVLDLARRQRSRGRGPLPGREPPEQERERQRRRRPLQAENGEDGAG
jgi:hypothetical protein